MPTTLLTLLLGVGATAAPVIDIGRSAPQRFEGVVADYAYSSGILRTDHFPDERLAQADPPLEHPNQYRAHWIADGHRRYWEVLSTTNPKNHWIGWNDGEVWRLYQPPVGSGDITSRKPEQSAVMPSRWFAEVEDEPWELIFATWIVIERDSGLDPGTTRVRLRSPTDESTEIEAVFEAGPPLLPRTVQRFRHGLLAHSYELTRKVQLENGTWIPASWKLFGVSYERRGNDDVVQQVLVWQVDLISARSDPAQASALATLDFPPRALIENEFSGESYVVGETADDALQTWIDSFEAKVDQLPTFPWIRSLPPATPREGAQPTDGAGPDLTSPRLCGPIALAALHRLHSRDDAQPDRRRPFAEWASDCRPGPTGTSIPDLLACSSAAGLTLELLEFDDRKIPDVRKPFIAVLEEGEDACRFAIATRSGDGAQDAWTVHEFPDGARRWLVGQAAPSWSGVGLFAADDPAVAALVASARAATGSPTWLLYLSTGLGVVAVALLAFRRMRTTRSQPAPSSSRRS